MIVVTLKALRYRTSHSSVSGVGVDEGDSRAGVVVMGEYIVPMWMRVIETMLMEPKFQAQKKK
jgi:hypothetical protein